MMNQLYNAVNHWQLENKKNVTIEAKECGFTLKNA